MREQLQAALGSAFMIERELGGGGMSRVFLAEESAFDPLLEPLRVDPRFGRVLERLRLTP